MQFNRVVHGKHGMMIVNAGDNYVGRSLSIYGEFSEAEILLLQLASAGGIAVDVGANIGAASIPIARHARLVIAIEAQPFVFQSLAGNVALNSLMNVQVINAAAGRENGTFRVPILDPRIPNNFGGLDITRRDVSATTPVPLLTVDSLGLPGCNLLKIDVEGMECDVIDGAASTISRFYPIISAENDRVENTDRLIEKLQSFGYQLFHHIIPLFNPTNYRGVKENVFENEASINIVAIPADKIDKLPIAKLGLNPIEQHAEA